uniref:Uncharacterized protein n=1 Tax=Megaselia scalaris TaxID=36166 RepID=T1GMT1_MEGSC
MLQICLPVGQVLLLPSPDLIKKSGGEQHILLTPQDPQNIDFRRNLLTIGVHGLVHALKRVD